MAVHGVLSIVHLCVCVRVCVCVCVCVFRTDQHKIYMGVRPVDNAALILWAAVVCFSPSCGMGMVQGGSGYLRGGNKGAM